MPLRNVLGGLGAALLFAMGVAAAALADSPPTTTETTSTTSSSTATSTSTTTSTIPATTTTTTQATTETPTPSTTTTPTARPAHANLPPAPGLDRGTSVAVKPPHTALQGAAAQHKKHRKHRKSKPLRVTPPLGQSQFVFPVVGTSGYGDTYGDPRSDVHGGWHHGDDIFASLGAPVVAVASGTINRVGWEKVGGWRLWERDDAADEFYYAHLSGYAPGDFHSRYVRAGQVIGFVGNTGDAFTGAPHLHFEIHPHQLLRLRYDGAVDPTKYLDSWSHLESVHAPRPVHPRLPRQPLFRSEARHDFRELLVARHFIEPALDVRPPHDPVPGAPAGSSGVQAPAIREAARGAAPQRESSALAVPLLAGFGTLALFATTMLFARLLQRRHRIS